MLTKQSTKTARSVGARVNSPLPRHPQGILARKRAPDAKGVGSSPVSRGDRPFLGIYQHIWPARNRSSMTVRLGSLLRVVAYGAYGVGSAEPRRPDMGQVRHLQGRPSSGLAESGGLSGVTGKDRAFVVRNWFGCGPGPFPVTAGQSEPTMLASYGGGLASAWTCPVLCQRSAFSSPLVSLVIASCISLALFFWGLHRGRVLDARPVVSVGRVGTSVLWSNSYERGAVCVSPVWSTGIGPAGLVVSARYITNRVE